MNGILEIFEDDNISIIKCPGGTSGTCQPNDLMKAHMIFRQGTTTGHYWENFLESNYEHPEYWVSHLLPYFKSSGVSAASQETYGYFFSTLGQLIHKSFSEDIVRRGKLYCSSFFLSSVIFFVSVKFYPLYRFQFTILKCHAVRKLTILDDTYLKLSYLTPNFFGKHFKVSCNMLFTQTFFFQKIILISLLTYILFCTMFCLYFQCFYFILFYFTLLY